MTNPSATAPDERRQFATFAAAGGTAALVNIAARWLLSHVVIYELAVTVAYVIGMTTAFVLTRRFVFKSGGQGWVREYRRFALVNAMSFVIVLGVSDALARLLLPAIRFRWHAEDIAHVIGVLSPILFSFYAHKHYSFGSKSAVR